MGVVAYRCRQGQPCSCQSQEQQGPSRAESTPCPLPMAPHQVLAACQPLDPVHHHASAPAQRPQGAVLLAAQQQGCRIQLQRGCVLVQQLANGLPATAWGNDITWASQRRLAHSSCSTALGMALRTGHHHTPLLHPRPPSCAAAHLRSAARGCSACTGCALAHGGRSTPPCSRSWSARTAHGCGRGCHAA